MLTKALLVRFVIDKVLTENVRIKKYYWYEQSYIIGVNQTKKIRSLVSFVYQTLHINGVRLSEIVSTNTSSNL